MEKDKQNESSIKRQIVVMWQAHPFVVFIRVVVVVILDVVAVVGVGVDTFSVGGVWRPREHFGDSSEQAKWSKVNSRKATEAEALNIKGCVGAFVGARSLLRVLLFGGCHCSCSDGDKRHTLKNETKQLGWQRCSIMTEMSYDGTCGS